MNRDISLNKYIASAGICSRRQADVLIDKGRVKINGRIAEKGNRVMKGDIVELNGKEIRPEAIPSVYLKFNKPAGIECTSNTKVKNNIIDFINYSERIFTVGRLDKDSEGLILLTNEGDVVNKMLKAHNEHEKEYLVEVNKPLTSKFLKNMANGVKVLNTTTLPCEVEAAGKKKFSIVLKQGLNRQIRRMCRHLGYEVKKLKRIRIMHITLEGLKRGEYQPLSTEEKEILINTLEESTNRSPYQ